MLQLRVDGKSYLVHALQISTRNKVGYRKLDGPSVEDHRHSVTGVWFVEPVAGTLDRFRRKGAGAIYEPRIIHGLDEMEATDIVFVYQVRCRSYGEAFNKLKRPSCGCKWPFALRGNDMLNL